MSHFDDEDIVIPLTEEQKSNLENIKAYNLPQGYLSHSQVEMYQRCPRQYEFRYIKEQTRPPGIALVLGSGTHKALETTHHHIVDHGAPAALEVVTAAFADSFEQHSAEIPAEAWKEEEIDKGKLKDAGVYLVSMYNSRIAPSVKPLVKDGVRGIEKKFEVNIEGVPMLGYIDLIDGNDTTVMSEDEKKLMQDRGLTPNATLTTTIADFKTKTKSMTEDEVKGSMQLTLYSYAENIPQVRFDQLLRQKTPQLKRLRSTRGPEDYIWLKQVVTSVADAISKGVFPPCSPVNWACSAKWCGYWNQCRGKKV